MRARTARAGVRRRPHVSEVLQACNVSVDATHNAQRQHAHTHMLTWSTCTIRACILGQTCTHMHAPLQAVCKHTHTHAHPLSVFHNSWNLLMRANLFLSPFSQHFPETTTTRDHMCKHQKTVTIYDSTVGFKNLRREDGKTKCLPQHETERGQKSGRTPQTLRMQRLPIHAIVFHFFPWTQWYKIQCVNAQNRHKNQHEVEPLKQFFVGAIDRSELLGLCLVSRSSRCCLHHISMALVSILLLASITFEGDKRFSHPGA